MTEYELEVIRLKLKIVAQDAAIEWVSGLFSTLSSLVLPDVQSRLREALKVKMLKTLQDYQYLSFPELTPEMSDLQSAEFVEAFQSVCKKIEDSLK